MRLPIQVEVIPFRYPDEADPQSMEVLALHRNPNKGGFWQPLTGGLESTDYNEQAAAYRETLEEIGVAQDGIARFVTLRHQFAFTGNDGQLLTEKCFAIQLLPTTEIRLSAEHDGMQWGSPAEIRGLYLWDDNRFALDELVAIERARCLGGASHGR
ncbi:MAG TPA: NUDIX domain-containing protein [Candidatus Saccharimonadales bacterium]|nr:NUDIX domain-containing protein [Candidatus Saccharimonadales bacterium]